MFQKWSLSSKFALILGIPLLFQIVLFGMLARLQQDAARDAATLSANLEMNRGLSLALRNILVLFTNASHLKTAYLTMPAFQHTLDDTLQSLASYKKYAPGSPEFKVVLSDVEDEFAKLRATAYELKLAYESGDVITNMSEKTELLVSTFRRIKALETKMRKLPVALRSQSDFMDEAVPMWRFDDLRYRQVLQLGIFIEALLLFGTLFWFGRDINARLKALENNGILLATQSPLTAAIAGADEIAQMDKALHDTAVTLMQSKQRESNIAINARDVICVLQEKLSFSEVSQAAQIVLGYSPTELLQLRIVNIVFDEDVTHVIKQLELCKGKESQFVECRMVKKDGGILETRWSVYYADAHYYCVIHDNSERKRAEAARREVLQMVSHDLKTPLNVLSNVLEMVAMDSFGDLSDRGKKLCSSAVSATDHMLMLINDLLDIEKIEAGMLQLNITSEPLAPIVKQSLDAVSGLSAKNQVPIICEVDDGLSVFADSDRVAQVLNNLLSNSIKFSNSGSPVILKAAAAGDFVELAVIDRGRGIPEQALPFIFDRFRQVEASDAKEKGGTGLGLAICKSLVELQGGKISAQSVYGSGTTIKFTLPALDKSEVAKR